jgi:hypothetical protein
MYTCSAVFRRNADSEPVFCRGGAFRRNTVTSPRMPVLAERLQLAVAPRTFEDRTSLRPSIRRRASIPRSSVHAGLSRRGRGFESRPVFGICLQVTVPDRRRAQERVRSRPLPDLPEVAVEGDSSSAAAASRRLRQRLIPRSTRPATTTPARRMRWAPAGGSCCCPRRPASRIARLIWRRPVSRRAQTEAKAGHRPRGSAGSRPDEPLARAGGRGWSSSRD